MYKTIKDFPTVSLLVPTGTLLIYAGNNRTEGKYLHIYEGAGVVKRATNIVAPWKPIKFEFVNAEKVFKHLSPEDILTSRDFDWYMDVVKSQMCDDILDAQSYAASDPFIREGGQSNKFSQYINKPEKSKMSNKMKETLNDNEVSARVAARITAGKTINAAVLEKLKPQLPLMVRGYADTAFAPIVIANLVNFAVSSFAADNDKAVWAANAMMDAAMTEFMASFNIEKILKEVLSSVDVTIPETE